MKSNSQILKEILDLAKTELSAGNDMGYTMPDGKHHIYIYPDQEDRWDDAPGDAFFVIEPNRVINGGHEPMGDTYLTSARDLSEVLIGCQWCMDWFEEDNRQQEKLAAQSQELPDELIVRLAHEAGWLESEGKIELDSWEDLQMAIRDAISEYYNESQDHAPFSIEETIEKILYERFPSEPEPQQSSYKEIHILACTQETDDGIFCDVSLHTSQEEAMAHADSLREKDEYDETRWNFDISSEVLDVSKLQNRHPSHLPEPKLLNSEVPSQKLSLDDQIRAAAITGNSNGDALLHVPQEPAR